MMDGNTLRTMDFKSNQYLGFDDDSGGSYGLLESIRVASFEVNDRFADAEFSSGRSSF